MALKFKDYIRGGKGDSVKDFSKFDQEELAVGVEVEFEHTQDKNIAKEIASDHLTENPKYYSELLKDKLADEPNAIKLAKSFGWNI